MRDGKIGNYRLLALLGQGGTADVYLGVTESSAAQGFTKLAVLKHIRGFDEESREDLFFDEARLAARLNHPNVVQTNEVGEADGAHFMVMEYLEGRVFDELLSKVGQGALSRERAAPLLLYVLSEALAGLHYAHDIKDFDGTPLNIVHRDVSPHNVMITYEGQVKVLDFGIATAARRLQRTAQGMVKGKLRYMAPEQALSLQVDRRTDVFAAGVILWEIVAGAELWSNTGDVQVFRGLLDGSYPTEVPGAPAELNRILKRSLARDATTRYPTAADFRRDLVEYLRERGQLEDARERLAVAMQSLFAFERTTMADIVQEHLAASVRGPRVESKPATATRPRISVGPRPPHLVPNVAPEEGDQTQTQTVVNPPPLEEEQARTVVKLRSALPSLSDAATLPHDATTITVSPRPPQPQPQYEPDTLPLPYLVPSISPHAPSEGVRWGMPPWIQRYFLEERAAKRRLVVAIACIGSAIVVGVLAALWAAAP